MMHYFKLCTADTSRVNRHSRVSHSPPETLLHRNNINPEFLPGDFQSEVGSQPEVTSIEKARTQQVNMKFQAIFNDVDMAASDHFTTPWSLGGRSSGSIPSSGSGHKFLPHEQEELPSSARMTIVQMKLKILELERQRIMLMQLILNEGSSIDIKISNFILNVLDASMLKLLALIFGYVYGYGFFLQQLIWDLDIK